MLMALLWAALYFQILQRCRLGAFRPDHRRALSGIGIAERHLQRPFGGDREDRHHHIHPAGQQRRDAPRRVHRHELDLHPHRLGDQVGEIDVEAGRLHAAVERRIWWRAGVDGDRQRALLDDVVDRLRLHPAGQQQPERRGDEKSGLLEHFFSLSLSSSLFGRYIM
jgi:hypothetical protein